MTTGTRRIRRHTEFFVIRDDKIVSIHLYYDQLEVLTQLGLMTTSGAG